VNVNRTVTRARELLAVVEALQLPFLAAAIAYYAFLSVVPLLVVVTVVATTVAGDALAAELLASLDEFLTPEAAELVESTLVEPSGGGGLTLVGLGLLLWGALRVFRGLDVAFSVVYGTDTTKPFLVQVWDAALVFGAVGLAIGATVAGSLLLSLSPVGLAGLGGSVGLLVVLPVVFFPLYYVFPAENVDVREAIPGAVFAGVGWTTLGTVFGIYAARVGSAELYGVLGAVLLLLIWFYFAGLVLLVGATLNAILAGRLEDRQLQHGGPPGSNQQESMGKEPADECGEADGNGTGTDRDRYSSDTPGDRRNPRGYGTRPEGRDRLPDGGHSPPDGGDGTTGGSGDGRGDGHGETDGSDDRREKGSEGNRRARTRTPYPGVQSLQLSRGDIPRHRGDRPNTVTEEDLAEMRERIEEFEAEIEERTVHREELEKELRGYVRQRTRRGRARGWGPYLVLLYGTVMTLGAFFFLGGLLAILAMLVIWLSTLGLYMLMVIIGVTSTALGLPGRIARRLAGLRNIR